MFLICTVVQYSRTGTPRKSVSKAWYLRNYKGRKLKCPFQFTVRDAKDAVSKTDVKSERRRIKDQSCSTALTFFYYSRDSRTKKITITS